MSLKRVLFVGDPHRPYHNVHAWNLMLDVAAWFRPHILINLGDMADFYSISHFVRDPSRKASLKHEVEDVNIGFDELDKLKADEKYFTLGNHENWLHRYLCEKAPELYGIISIQSLFRLRERGWHVTKYRHSHKVGKLRITHDFGSAGRYEVFKSLDTAGHSVVFGHTHRLQYAIEGNADGEYRVAASFGWLGDVEQIDYQHRVKALRYWALGFGIGWLDTDTDIVHIQPVPIVRRQCVVGGKLFKG